VEILSLRFEKVSRDSLKPVPEKMSLEMLVEMQFEIRDGGEILVSCKFKLDQNLNFNGYREMQRNSNQTNISI